MSIIVWASGLAGEGTGIRTYQDQIYPRLELNGISLRIGTARARTFASATHSLSGMLRQGIGMRDELFPRLPEGVDAVFAVKPPYPLIPARVPLAVVVCDLRWRRTRALPARTYRYLDLHGAIIRAQKVIAISHATARDVLALSPGCAQKLEIVHPGSGKRVWPADLAYEQRSIDLLLLGSAPHKRNEEIVEALELACPDWVRHVATVGVGEAIARRVDRLVGAGLDSHTRLGVVSDAELSRVLASTRVFAMVGRDEGFGLPILEAIEHGADVLVAPTALNFELWSTPPVRFAIPDAPTALKAEPPWAEETHRTELLERYSWDACAVSIAETLRALAARGGPRVRR
jgi:glycosyltransferase involved in cell wall biosynthesis